MITVLLPVYNGAPFLREAIESILGQSFQDFELLIIDDASTDESAAVAQSFSDKRVRFVKNEQNLGLIGTLNKGVQLAKGAFIARMDQDDIAAPERLAHQLALFEKNERLVAAGTAMSLLSARGERVGTLPVFVEHEQLKRALAVTNPFAHSAMMLRRDAVRQVGGYSDHAYAAEDYDLWCRLSTVGELSNCPEELLAYRLNPQGMSISLRAKQRGRREKIADQEWATYGAAGPAPLQDWSQIWPARDSKKFSQAERLLHSTLHLLFAKGYRRRGKWGIAVRHLQASLGWYAGNRGSYLALLMFVLPYAAYASLEERLAILLNNARAGQ